MLPYLQNPFQHTAFEAGTDHPVPAVRHSVWKHQDKIGVILVNWTAAPADFKADFDPALYEIPAGAQSYTATLIDETGPGTPVAHPSIGEIHTIDATTSGALGAVPAHTVWVVELAFQ